MRTKKEDEEAEGTDKRRGKWVDPGSPAHTTVSELSTHRLASNPAKQSGTRGDEATHLPAEAPVAGDRTCRGCGKASPVEATRQAQIR